MSACVLANTWHASTRRASTGVNRAYGRRVLVHGRASQERHGGTTTARKPEAITVKVVAVDNVARGLD